MRWKNNTLENREGETRVIRKFLVFPKKLDDEWRWWEHVYIMQKVCAIDVGGIMEWGRYAWRWCDVHWLDTPKACFEIYKTKLDPVGVKAQNWFGYKGT